MKLVNYKHGYFNYHKKLCLLVLLLHTLIFFAQSKNVITGSERLEVYLPILKNKNIALVANQTSLVRAFGGCAIKRGIHVQKVFSPEHISRKE